MHLLDTQPAQRPKSRPASGSTTSPCCTDVCPGIKITDNTIIPMKERVVDRKYDPLVWLGNKIGMRDKDRDERTEV